MSETTKTRPQPYVEQRPGNQILASDWNELQVRAREEIAAAQAEITALRAELEEIRGLRQAVADELAALKTEIKTAKIDVAGDAAVQGFVHAVAGGRFHDIVIGRGEYGDLAYPYETIQLQAHHNLRICYGAQERFFLGNSGEFRADTIRTKSLWIGGFRLEAADGWLRIFGPDNGRIAELSEKGEDRLRIFRDADGRAPYWYYNGNWGEWSESAQRGVRSTRDGQVEIRLANGRWVFQSDGNLVKYDNGDHARWSSGQGW